MAQFNIGDKVVRVGNDAHGTVINVRPGRGRTLYTVMFPTGAASVLEADLRTDYNVSDPFERCKNGIFGSYSEYSKRNTTFKIRNSNNSTVSSLKASKTLFRAYQFKPLLKFLNSPNRRLLVADEVGLGKTIEAGHIMLELKARKELKNVLIVCPKSLQEKWKAELYEKFGLAFKIIENTKDLIADLSSRQGMVRAIVNYEKIRFTEKKENGSRVSNLVDFLRDNPQNFSLVLCDEAHKMRNSTTHTYKGAELIMSMADTALFLTATPIMISEENLYNLLHLLDSSRYYNYDIFRNRMNENRPFVQAMSNLNHGMPAKEIAARLEKYEATTTFFSNKNEIYSTNRTLNEIYEDDPVYNEILQICRADEDTHETRSRLLYLFSTMSMMNTVFSRTRKREVTTDMSQAERKPHLVKVKLTSEEQKDFDDVISQYTDDNSYADEWGERLTQGGSLGLVQRKRQVASSVWAYLNDETKLERGYDEYADLEDSKVNHLLNVIQEVFANGPHKIVVFALFRKTLNYLRIRLTKAGYGCIVIHGQVDNRDEKLQRFRDDDKVQILLSSEVGSEGLDMQFCNSMVNYDLPWNPMVVEQRIGRIDRFGQQSPVVNIYNFVVEGSIQEDIYLRLLERIGIFQGTIGDMEAILDAEVHIGGRKMTIQEVYNKMEKELFTKDLTKEERNRKIAEVEQAIANEKQNLQHLQEGLSNTLTNDAYFKEQIDRILKNNAYVTEQELQNYLAAAIRQHLTTCRMEEVKPSVWEFQLPQSHPTVLRNFLIQYCDNNDEAATNANQFRHKVENADKFRITFSQDVAYRDRSINYLNIYHPMIQACMNYFVENEDDTSTSFSYALTADDLLHRGDRYYMGLYEISSHRMVQGVRKDNAELLPVVFNLQTRRLEQNQETTDRIFRRSQVEGMEHNATNEDTDAETLDDMNCDFTERISQEIRSRMEKETRLMESDRRRNEQQTREYYASRIEIHWRTIKKIEDLLEFYFEDDKKRRQYEGVIPLVKYNIDQMEKERDEHLEKINEDRRPSMEDKLLSLNLITII